jgi:hypothetical protein
MSIFERLEEWRLNGHGRGWELRGLSSGQFLVALFDGSRFICDGKWNTPDGAFEAARFRFDQPNDARAWAYISSQEKQAYLESIK